MKALDLFCGAGGATKGLQRAGFHVTGVDVRPQPRYCGDAFVQSDAMTFPLEGYDFIWASPPCQLYTRMNAGLLLSQGKQKHHPDLVPKVRSRLQASGSQWVIENVVGSPLKQPTRLCGTSFGLTVERHRLFESSFLILGLRCHHALAPAFPALHRRSKTRGSRCVGVYGGGRGKGDNADLWRQSMGIEWMTRKEMTQAIPPAYSQYIAQFAIAALKNLEVHA